MRVRKLSVVLLLTHAASLVFMLVPHRDLYTGNISPKPPRAISARRRCS